MRKVIAGINMTLDGFCDHTAMIADEELHEHYSQVLRNSGALIYGRITYRLMEDYWPLIVDNPTGDKATDDFALAIQHIPKLVFSRTMKEPSWENATLAKGSVEEEVLGLKKQEGKDILVGSPSMIVTLLKYNLIDEYQLCVHPVIAGNGLPLFRNIADSVTLKLFKTKVFGSGAILLYYRPDAKG